MDSYHGLQSGLLCGVVPSCSCTKVALMWLRQSLVLHRIMHADDSSVSLLIILDFMKMVGRQSSTPEVEQCGHMEMHGKICRMLCVEHLM